MATFNVTLRLTSSRGPFFPLRRTFWLYEVFSLLNDSHDDDDDRSWITTYEKNIVIMINVSIALFMEQIYTTDCQVLQLLQRQSVPSGTR